MLISSILIYLLFAATLYFFAENARKSELLGQNSNADLSLWIAVIIFALLSGVRYRVGSDCEEYAESYNLLVEGRDISNSVSLEKAELGFLWFSKFLAILHVPRFIYMGFWAFLEIAFITLALKHKKNLLPFLYLILILGPYYLSFTNGIRQSVVSCVFVYVVQELVDNGKWQKYLILILLSLLLHKSALFLLPFVLLIFYKKSPNVVLCLILYVLCNVIGQLPVVREYAMLGQAILKIAGYSSYADKMEYTLELDSIITSFGPRSMVLMLINLIVILYSSMVSRRFQNDKFFNVSFLLFMFYACGTGLTASMDGLFSRPFLYFMPFVLICQAYTMVYLSSPDERYDFKWFTIIVPRKIATMIFYCVAVVFCSYCILFNIAECNTPDETTLFKFIFLR